MDNSFDVQSYTFGRDTARIMIDDDRSNGEQKSVKQYKKIAKEYDDKTFMEGFLDIVEENI